MGVNPDQRMSEDALQALRPVDGPVDRPVPLAVLLVSFAGVLWTISKDFTFRVGAASTTPCRGSCCGPRFPMPCSARC